MHAIIRSLLRVARPTGPALSLVALCFAMQGCPAKAPPAGVRFPITSGFHTVLPSPDQRILIWADPAVAEIAAEWLRTHHYSTLLTPHPAPFQAASEAIHRFADRQAALAVAREMKAEFVLFLERDERKDGALIESSCGSRFSIDVRITGLSMERQETTLRGDAHYPHCVTASPETMRALTCQAFATAWGFRPSGQLDIPSHLMCTAGQTESTPTR
ncbi:MAG TPA: hypothetical protein VFS39_00070 [Nitrospira sp.]|nr:hypothetical protein [Nitrospira sp.]